MLEDVKKWYDGENEGWFGRGGGGAQFARGICRPGSHVERPPWDLAQRRVAVFEAVVQWCVAPRILLVDVRLPPETEAGHVLEALNKHGTYHEHNMGGRKGKKGWLIRGGGGLRISLRLNTLLHSPTAVHVRF